MLTDPSDLGIYYIGKLGFYRRDTARPKWFPFIDFDSFDSVSFLFLGIEIEWKLERNGNVRTWIMSDELLIPSVSIVRATIENPPIIRDFFFRYLILAKNYLNVIHLFVWESFHCLLVVCLFVVVVRCSVNFENNVDNRFCLRTSVWDACAVAWEWIRQALMRCGSALQTSSRRKKIISTSHVNDLYTCITVYTLFSCANVLCVILVLAIARLSPSLIFAYIFFASDIEKCSVRILACAKWNHNWRREKNADTKLMWWVSEWKRFFSLSSQPLKKKKIKFNSIKSECIWIVFD